jgi:NAD(P)H-quinone oxidoreductase subunit 5
VALPQRLGRPARVAGSLLAAVGVYAAFAWAWGIDPVAEPALLALGAILVLGLAQIVAPALDSDGPLEGTARAGGLALGVATAFFGLEAGAQALLQPVLPEAAAPGAVRLSLMALAVLAFAAVVLVQILGPALPETPRGRRLAVHLRNGFYANALFDRLVGALDAPPPPPPDMPRRARRASR